MWDKIRESKSAILGFQVFYAGVIGAAFCLYAGEYNFAQDVFKFSVGVSGILIGNKTIMEAAKNVFSKKEGA